MLLIKPAIRVIASRALACSWHLSSHSVAVTRRLSYVCCLRACLLTEAELISLIQLLCSTNRGPRLRPYSLRLTEHNYYFQGMSLACEELRGVNKWKAQALVVYRRLLYGNRKDCARSVTRCFLSFDTTDCVLSLTRATGANRRTAGTLTEPVAGSYLKEWR